MIDLPLLEFSSDVKLSKQKTNFSHSHLNQPAGPPIVSQNSNMSQPGAGHHQSLSQTIPQSSNLIGHQPTSANRLPTTLPTKQEQLGL